MIEKKKNTYMKLVLINFYLLIYNEIILGINN